MQVISEFRGINWFLSNFYPREITWQGKVYASTEHLFQARKATNEFDHERVRLAPGAGEAKRLGQIIEKRADWEDIKTTVMLEALRLKFASGPCRTWLLATEGALLVEGNTWHDDTWGHCYCSQHVHRLGQNHLGRLLMQVRGELRGE